MSKKLLQMEVNSHNFNTNTVIIIVHRSFLTFLAIQICDIRASQSLTLNKKGQCIKPVTVLSSNVKKWLSSFSSVKDENE
jgi:hypothetical protein